MKTIIAPSILSANFARLEDDIKAAERGGADYFHIDVMDGHFVPNISFGPIVARTMRRITKTPLDAHLMITNPDKYIPEFVDAGVELIYPHVEATYDVYRTVQLITDFGAKAGITLNPGSPAEWVEPLLDRIDYVLVMSVCPGFGGQKFQPDSIRKIRRLRELLDSSKPSVQIAVDGGVSKDNIRSLREAGANFFVAGSSVFGTGDISKAVRELRAAAGES
ncbi:MAG: ribulose-phosphate 3-epimerase [Candidatus Thorarchaeota archaeon]|nr:ribulose-phosphate 3-epimerase [Candidatus Thorarchaeota archaeon]